MLRASGHARVYSAVREADGRAVVAKVFELESPAVEARVEHEFALLEALDIEGVVKALALQRVGQQLVLLLERVPGQDLSVYTEGQPVEVETFLSIAIQLTDILARLHARRVIHRDIKPANVLITPDSGQIHLADFGISVLLESERRDLYDPQVLTGTLPYISPEQTGRTGRKVDFRSDLYSLGVTFYELLTARRPFEYSAPLELIHAHLARAPRPPVELRSSIPAGLSRIVLKLLAKAPERRYQTAAGLARDLRRLRELLDAGDAGLELELARDDLPPGLSLSTRLHGRDSALHELRNELERVRREGSARVTLLSGPAGVGKSTVLSEFAGLASTAGARVGQGRFDPHRELPYSAFLEALDGLVEQLLTLDEPSLASHRALLSEALGGLSPVVCELLPKLALILGEQPSPPPVPPPEARNRVHLGLARLLSTLASAASPLLVVLDDLHAADPSSLQLLRVLLEGDLGPVMILGARQAEAKAEALGALGHRLAAMHLLRVVDLRPWTAEAATEFLADTLAKDPQTLEGLAAVLHPKTGGSPLLLRELLVDLERRGLLERGPSGWSWDVQAVAGAPLPDSVFEAVRARFEALDDGPRELLARAACLGASFDLESLEVATARPMAELTAELYALVDAGLVGPAGLAYAFAHDRLCEVARAHLDADTRSAVHWAIGRHWQLQAGRSDRSRPGAGADRLFEIVDQLDASLPRELDEAARVELAQLNLRAGQRAIAAAAYAPALRYLEAGVELVAASTPKVAAHGAAAPDAELVIALHFARAQSLALSTRYEDADAAFSELLRWPLPRAMFGRVVALRIRLLTMEDRPQDAIRLAIDAIAECGMRIAPDPSLGLAVAGLLVGWLRIRDIGIEDWKAMKRCEDPEINAVFDILTAAVNVAYVTSPGLFVALVGLRARLLVRHGFHPCAAQAISQVAIGITAGARNTDSAAALCDRALALCEEMDENPSRARVESAAYLFVWHQSRPLPQAIASMPDACRRALVAGDFEYAGFMTGLRLSMEFDVGVHLRVLGRKAKQAREELERWGSAEMALVAWMIRGLTVVLTGSEGEGDELEALRDTEALSPEVVESRNGSRVTVFAAIVNRAIADLLLGRPEAALTNLLPIIADAEEVMFATWMIPRTALATALCVQLHRLRGHDNGRHAPRTLRRALRTAMSILERWGKNCPENYGHYLTLARGMAAAVKGRSRRAMDLLERARAEAEARSCRWVEGLACERLAELGEREGLSVYARGARERAWQLYAAWGAELKLEAMREAHPEQFADPRELMEHTLPPTRAGQRTQTQSESSSASASRSRARARAQRSGASSGRWRGSSATGSSSGNDLALDLESVLESVSAISQELSVDVVVAHMLEAAITNAGADHATLVLERQGAMGVVARSKVDLECEFFPRPIPLDEADHLVPPSLLRFVQRTRDAVVLDDAREDPRFAEDPYVVRKGVVSLLGLPILKGRRVLGVLALENRLSAYCFTPDRLESLRLIAGQAATALENATLYSALRRGEARWRSLVTGVPDIIALLDERGAIEFVNRPGLFVVDSPDDKGARRPVQPPGLGDEAAEAWRGAVRAVLADGDPRELELQVARSKKKPPRWFAVRLAAIEVAGEDEDESAAEADDASISQVMVLERRHAIALATDITARKRAEADKDALDAKLRQQQRLESLGTLASGVAHEINNPVQGILNYSELIHVNVEDAGIVREFTEEITAEANRVAAIVRNLLSFSRQDTDQQFEPATVDAIYSATLMLIKSVLRRDQVTIELVLPHDLPQVRCRIQQIQQIVMNLVTNARDALNEVYPGYDERKRIELKAERLGEDRVRMIVEDSGPGIPAEVLPHIFDPFFTTKGRDQGTGLGLSVSHGIAKDHGGELSVDTAPGAGTRFYLDLPVA
ncbi:Serine/Threonine protein kinase and Signal Transduction Histidine Kinase [Plesiocystis pacifica SIR-1]|uniref:histidine kinase n=1 Tax=Plesiocystis pacifica SIR-1 TaxID=391625 RepID=A6G485_9BACT|nr:AAA family ATPase [Plesiocystis pacifica]EDM79408.1 Serine/Threonine protein kinase and Signal Transduction Histidine Kinase [Plesiocystis pacifica SIR-1]